MPTQIQVFYPLREGGPAERLLFDTSSIMTANAMIPHQGDWIQPTKEELKKLFGDPEQVVWLEVTKVIHSCEPVEIRVFTQWLFFQ
ncbi:hypothetical protein [Tellurirhabdus bombi]|uniref:hypothetical protein n=1 Tax=Tellurirhabdus bombi TaxID=2907205 RepID=UPI001F346E33|nr:hypothetical protein [Tellurirhabdus bombi]